MCIKKEKNPDGSVGWGCRIHWLYLCTGYDSPNECPGYDIKQSDDEAPVNAGALGNVEYSFIAIAPLSTLA